MVCLLAADLRGSNRRDSANRKSKENPMKKLRKIGLLFSITILIAAFGSSARASEFDKLTIFTFSAPIEVPGNITLPAGTYVFKLLDSSAARNIVQIFNEHQTKLYATILTISAERLEPTDETAVEFYETAAGAQNALKTWFYPGDTDGQEFVYPKARAAELAKTAKQPATVVSSNSTPSQAQP
jgi:hypothetical protein